MVCGFTEGAGRLRNPAKELVRPAGIEPATYGFEGHAPDATTGRHRTTSSSIRELGSPRSWGWRPVLTADVRWLWASRGQVMGSRWAGLDSNLGPL